MEYVESLVSGAVYGTESGEQVATVEGDWRGLVEIFKEDATKELMCSLNSGGVE